MNYKRTIINIIKLIPKLVYKPIRYLEAMLYDASYNDDDIPSPLKATHLGKESYIVNNFDREGIRILEIGSREVTGPSKLRRMIKNAEYVGFDYYDGKNVDITGDVHYLSSYFDNKFDVIYSTASFEHFAMPWLISEQISNILKIGGQVVIETHFSYRAHERPWNFFQFSDLGLQVLFNREMGFRCIDAGMSSPIRARFSIHAEKYLRLRPIGSMYAHSAFIGEKVEEYGDFTWDKVNMNKLVLNTQYPKL